MKIITPITVLLVAIELILILGSWLGSVFLGEGEVSSLLSQEGIRWFIGRYAFFTSTPLLILLLLIAMTYGIVQKSRVINAISTLYRTWWKKNLVSPLDYRQRIALHLSAIVAVIMLAAIGWMTLTPHAILLSVTGTLTHSSFSHGIIPMICLTATLSAMTYGMGASTLPSLQDTIKAMIHGIETVSPLLFLYILVAQVYFSICYIFQLL